MSSSMEKGARPASDERHQTPFSHSAVSAKRNGRTTLVARAEGSAEEGRGQPKGAQGVPKDTQRSGNGAKGAPLGGWRGASDAQGTPKGRPRKPKGMARESKAASKGSEDKASVNQAADKGAPKNSNTDRGTIKSARRLSESTKMPDWNLWKSSKMHTGCRFRTLKCYTCYLPGCIFAYRGATMCKFV